MNDISDNNIDAVLSSLLEAVSNVEHEIEVNNNNANKTIGIIKERVEANIQNINENLAAIDTAQAEAEDDFDELILKQVEDIADEQ